MEAKKNEVRNEYSKCSGESTFKYGNNKTKKRTKTKTTKKEGRQTKNKTGGGGGGVGVGRGGGGSSTQSRGKILTQTRGKNPVGKVPKNSREKNSNS